jgi:hypothetical protein
MGFVRVLATKPAQEAEQTCTIGESGGRRPFQKSFVWEYVAK